MNSKILLILLTLILNLVGCENPLSGNLKGLSAIEDGHTPQLNKPGNFSIDSVTTSDSKITLAWNSSARALSYSVKYGTIFGKYTITANCSTSPCSISGLTNGQTYLFMVSAINAAGSTDLSTPAVGIPSNLPSTPTAVTANGANGSVAIAWAAASGPGVITYNILRSTTSGSGYVTIASSLSNLTYTDSTVTNNTTYYYVVTSTNIGGTSPYSNQVTALPLSAPGIPSSLSATLGSASVNLNWTASSGLGTITYNILRSTTSGSGYTSIATGVSTNSYTDSSAINGTTYYYVVNATNGGGTSSSSTQVTATPIATPTITSIVVNGSGSFALTFPASVGATSYNLKYGTATGVYGTTLTGVTSPKTISGLTAGTIYYFKLVAVNATGSVSSAESTATPLASFAISSTDITSSTQITLAWAASAGASSYTVKYGTATGVYGTTFSTSATTPTTVTGLTAGTTYYFMVTAVNANGSINANAETSLAPASVPTLPTSLVATGTNGSVGLTWSASTGTGPITYTVYRSTTTGSGYASIATALATNSYTDNTVSNGTTYYYVVKAINSGGSTANSNEASALPMLPPTAPSSLVPTIGVANVKLDWTVASGLGTITYNIYRSTTSGAGFASIGTASTNTYTDLTAVNGTTYYYKITATNAGGTSPDSNEVSAKAITLPTITSIAVNGSGSLAITFPASTGASTYNIKYGTVTGVYGTTVTGVTSPTTISSLTPGTVYYFKLVAVNSTGSVDSAESTATPLGSFAITSTTIANSTQITLAWGASTGAASYTVKYGTATGVYGTIFSTAATSPTTVTGLTTGTTYYFMVTAVNTNGSLNTNAESSLAPVAISSIPTTLAASGTNGSVGLTWTASTGTGPITYNVLRSTTSGSGYSSIATAVATNSYTDSTVTNGTTYYYVVTSTNAGGTSANSNEANALPMLPPTAPSSLAPTVGIANVKLDWTASSGLGTITYNILRSTTSGSGYSSIATSSSNTYTDLTATNGTTYYYKITATNAGGTSLDSNEVNATPIGSFSISSVAINGANALQVTWGASTGATSFSLKYGTTAGVYTTTLTNQTSPTTVSSLTAGTTYYFLVTAINSSGSVNATSEVSGIPLASFTMSSITPAVGSMAVNWNSTAGSTSYDILYDTSSHAASGSYASSSTNKTSGNSISSLTAGTTYYFRIRANNASGSLTSTNELSGSVYQNFTLNIPFDALSESSYVLSNSSKTEFVSGVARLTASDQTDDDNASSGFGGATLTGALWDATNSYLRLNTTTNNAELDSSWTPQWSSIVGYWNFNGSVGSIANAASISASIGPNGTVSNVNTTGMAYSTGQLNQGITFDGVDDYISLTDIDTFSPSYNSDKLSISIWAKIASNSNTNGDGGNNRKYLVAKGTSSNYEYALYRTSGGSDHVEFCIFTLDGSGSNCVTLLSAYTVGVYYHFAVTVSASTISGYVNGALVASTTKTITMGNGTRAVRVGARDNGYFEGDIDDLAIWSTTLAASEIATIYSRQSAKYAGVALSRVMDAWSSLAWSSISNNTSIPFYKELPGTSGSESTSAYPSIGTNLMTNLIGLWHLNETSGTTAIDSSSTGQNGTAASVNASMIGQPGVLNSAYTLNGTSQYVFVGSNAAYNFSNVTISAWVKNSTTGTSQSIIDGDNCCSNRKFQFRLDSSGTFGVILFFNDASLSSWSSSTKINDGKWHHLIATYDQAFVKLYVDGKMEVNTAETRVMNNVTTTITIGRYAGSAAAFFNGSIDEAAIWSRAISTTEALQLYRRGGNRLKYQVRSCSNSDCSDQEALTTSGRGWKGPDNTFNTYFSELYNNSSINSSATPTGNVNIAALNLAFSSFSASSLSVANNRYFQYRTILESDDKNTLCIYGSGATACSPELKSNSVGPLHYDINNPSVTSKSTIGSSYVSLDANAFIETLGSGSCTGARYTISVDGTNFYYYNGSAWALSSNTYATATDASTVASNLSTLQASMGLGTLQIKTFLHSDGVTACEVSNIQMTGKKY